jgi:hypothetical protein
VDFELVLRRPIEAARLVGTWESDPSALRPHPEKLFESIASGGASLESATLNYFGAMGVYSPLQ